MLLRFELGKELGSGAYSSVVMAKHRLSGQPVALKVFKASQVRLKKNRAMMEKEIEINGRISHPNIVRMYQVRACQRLEKKRGRAKGDACARMNLFL